MYMNYNVLGPSKWFLLNVLSGPLASVSLIKNDHNNNVAFSGPDLNLGYILHLF